MKKLKEYELAQESENELYGFTASCFVKNGIVWNEFYLSYTDLPLNMINDLFYEDDDINIETYSNLPISHIQGDPNINSIMDTHIIYSPKYNFKSILSPEFVCNINENMEVEAIHSVDFNGNFIELDVSIDHKNDVIYVANHGNDKQSIYYFDKSGRITKADLIYDLLLISTDEFYYDDINHEIFECLKDETDDIIYTTKIKTDDNGKNLYSIGYDDDNEINIISRRINVSENMYIELSKFRTLSTFDDIEFDD